MVSGMLALLVATTGVVGPDGPDKAPQRYRVDVKIEQVVDLSSAGMSEMRSSATSTSYVTLTVSDTTGGSLMHLVIDSVKVSTVGQQFDMTFNQTMADSLKNQFFHAYIVNGRSDGPAKPSVENNPVISLVAPAVSALYPGIGDKANQGDKWSDTTRSETSTAQGTQNTSQIVDWVVTSRNGDVLTVTGTGNGTVNADMDGQQVSGTIATTAEVTTVVGGPAAASKVVSKQSITVLAPQFPEPIPVNVTSEATLTKLP